MNVPHWTKVQYLFLFPKAQVVDKVFERPQIGDKLLELNGNENLKIYFHDFRHIPVTLE